MQISGQNQIPVSNPQYNNVCANDFTFTPQNCNIAPTAQFVPNPNPAQYPVTNPQYYYPQPQYIQQPQNVQVPSGATGVNIQIFNPAVCTPGANGPTYNVNAPSYPGNYYTGQLGPCNCQNQQSQNTKVPENTNNSDNEKNKKGRVVLLTDEYIKNLENYLNSQDKNIRLNAAKEVFCRLDEDPSRKDDKALTALINKMLQDPNQEVRLLALCALEGRIVNGDDLTVMILQNMQNNPQGQGFDASDAAKILLDMSGRRVNKDIQFDPDKRTKIKTDKTDEKKDKKQIKSKQE